MVRRYRRHTLLGVVARRRGVGGLAALALWMLPVVLGLALAIPLAVVSGQPRAGVVLRRLGLLLIPEERQPPAVLARANALARELHDEPRRVADSVPRSACCWRRTGPCCQPRAGRAWIRSTRPCWWHG